MTGLRILAAVALFAVGTYWSAGALYELAAARKPPGLLGVSLIRRVDPEPILSAAQWRKGALLLMAMAGCLFLLGVRLLQGWP